MKYLKQMFLLGLILVQVIIIIVGMIAIYEYPQMIGAEALQKSRLFYIVLGIPFFTFLYLFITEITFDYDRKMIYSRWYKIIILAWGVAVAGLTLYYMLFLCQQAYVLSIGDKANYVGYIVIQLLFIVPGLFLLFKRCLFFIQSKVAKFK